MIGKGTESEHLVSVNEARNILEERKKGRELTYEQQLAYEHAKKFGSEKSDDDKLKKALMEIGVSEKTAIKIIDVMPKNTMTLKQILTHENRSFSNDEIAKMMALLK